MDVSSNASSELWPQGSKLVLLRENAGLGGKVEMRVEDARNGFESCMRERRAETRFERHLS